MKKIYSLLLSLCFLQSSFCQVDWQEHLSHDRRAYGHLGHFMIDGKVTLFMGNEISPMNTLETIEGNTKKTQSIVSDYFTFRTKTTRTGIDSKEVLLLEPWDYDINGFGAFSIHERNDEIFNKNIQGVYDPYMGGSDYIFIKDAFMSGGPFDPKECISYDTRYFLNYLDEIQNEIELDGSFAYHEGLDGSANQISKGIFRSTDLSKTDSLDLGAYTKLFNDPYNNQLIELEEKTLNRYAYIDLSYEGTDSLLFKPIEIQFVGNGFYYLYEHENDYTIYFFSDSSLNSEVFYELPKIDAVEDFNIFSFEVDGEDIYFFGLYESPLTKAKFSYVQKRNLIQDFTPVRKDLTLASVSIYGVPTNNYGLYDYEYSCTVKNLSPDTVNHFSIYNGGYDIGIGGIFFVERDVNQTLAPGDSIVLEGEFSFYGLTYFTLHIVGVDFGLDSDPSDNSFTADVITSVEHEKVENSYQVTPNPGSHYISILGSIEEIESISILNHMGQIIDIDYKELTHIDISDLLKGHYWVQIKTKSKVEIHNFVKI